jgi:TrmH family RNA methyltransferase
MDSTTPNDLALLRASLVDDTLVFLDGFHAIKHAMRFGATIELIACASQDNLAELADALAPDIADTLVATARVIPRADVDAITAPRSHRTGVWGVARRPQYTLAQVIDAPGPIVLLESPQNQGNVGATIRVAAAAGAAGVLTTGTTKLWTPAVIRGAAGLHFAIPVVQLRELDALPRPIVAIDPTGVDISNASIPARPILAFGTERHGLSQELLDLASASISLPMRPGVSSLNLATAVGITLYAPVVRQA